MATAHPRILIIDDDEGVRNLLRELLESAGFGVELAADAHSGVASVVAKRPDLVILDKELPQFDGIALCERFRDDFHRPDLPVVILTASSAPGDVARSIQAGAIDFVRKPFEPTNFIERIRLALEAAPTALG